MTALELQARRLTVRRGSRRVLETVDLDARSGAVTGILGPNGAGKSTLVRALGGLLEYDGEVRLGSRELRGIPPRERAREVTYVPQKTALGAGLSVATVVGQGRYAHSGGIGRPGTADMSAVEAALERTGTSTLRDRRFDRLSVGEQRRVLLARALATRARILLLDEPTAALDIRHALECFALLRKLAEEGFTVVVVLHAIAAARRFTDRTVLLRAGEVYRAGDTHAVLDSTAIREVYGVKLIESGAPSFCLEEAPE